jgi:tRNA(fMet)-specific endonuclease VapC
MAKNLLFTPLCQSAYGFIIPLEVVSLDESAAHVYGEIRATLEKSGTPIGAMDMLIAAHAL